MNSLFGYLNKCNDFLGNITIDQAFIDYRNQMKWKFKANGRDENTRLMHADCLIIEYSLIQAAMASNPNVKEYDIDVNDFNAKVDIKIYDKWFNIPSDKLEWYKMNIKKGLLTHFGFYRWVNKPTKPLEVGDVVQVTLTSVVSAEEVLRNLNTSQYDGWYYIPKK
jgi:hypothetical protein